VTEYLELVEKKVSAQHCDQKITMVVSSVFIYKFPWVHGDWRYDRPGATSETAGCDVCLAEFPSILTQCRH
jgi:hypothetical protein